MDVFRYKNGEKDGVVLTGVQPIVAKTVAENLNRSNKQSGLRFAPGEEASGAAGGHTAAGGSRV